MKIQSVLRHIGIHSSQIGEDKSKLCEDLIKEYAVFVAQRSLNHASEIALMTFHCGTFKVNTPTQYHQMGADNIQIDKQSIVNTMKKLLLFLLASVLFIGCSTPVKRDENIMADTEVSQIVSSANFNAFKMKVDSVEYIVARTPSGIAIVKHSK